jgi:hypothetical protein
MLIVPAVVVVAVWVSVCAAAPEFLWQGLRLALGHVSQAELLAALLIGVVLAFFVEPLMERLRAVLSRADHPHASHDRLHDALFTAGLSLAFALTSVFLHEAMTAFVTDSGHDPSAGLAAGFTLTISWALVPFAITLAWLSTPLRLVAIPLGALAVASSFIAGWLFDWPAGSVIATALPCVAILALGYRRMRAPNADRLASFAPGVALVALAWLVLAMLFDTLLPRFAMYDATSFWMDVRFYCGWALGLLLAPSPNQDGTRAVSRTPPRLPLA